MCGIKRVRRVPSGCHIGNIALHGTRSHVMMDAMDASRTHPGRLSTCWTRVGSELVWRQDLLLIEGQQANDCKHWSTKPIDIVQGAMILPNLRWSRYVVRWISPFMACQPAYPFVSRPSNGPGYALRGLNIRRELRTRRIWWKPSAEG